MKNLVENKFIALIALFLSFFAMAQDEIPQPPNPKPMGDGFGGEETPIDMFIPLLVIIAIGMVVYYYRKIRLTSK